MQTLYKLFHVKHKQGVSLVRKLVFTLLKPVRLVDAVQTQLIDVPDNSCGHVRTSLLVYGTSTKIMECH